MLYFCLSKHSYIKCTENYAYIANQSTGSQLIYDANGEAFVSMLTHTPQKIEDALNKLSLCYEDVNVDELRIDFIEFLNELSDAGFVILGTTVNQISRKNREKIEYHLDIPQITDLTIEITNCCNERCVHCYLPNKLKDNGEILEIDVIKSLVEEFVEMGGKTVTLTGGEVMLYQDLLDLLHYISEKKLKIIIYSNLIALSEKILQNLKEINISFVKVSLYAVNTVAHDSITGVKGSCQRTIKSIELLKNTGIPLKIACPVMKENSKDVTNVLDYAKKQDIPIELELNITPREDGSKDNLEHRLTINEMEELLMELMEYDKEYTVNLLQRHKNRYDENFNLAEYLNYPVCTAGHYGLYVTAGGKVTICPNMQGKEASHINKDTLKSIWYNSESINSLRKTTEGKFIECINCKASDYCFRCFARNYTETGDCMKYPEYACQMAFLAKKIVENKNRPIC